MKYNLRNLKLLIQIFKTGEKYYFEIKVNKGSLIKIGISRPDVVLN